MSYGFFGLKPQEFWELQPKDIILMNEGFEMRRKYEERLHLETLIFNRLNTTVLAQMNSRKRIRPKDLYHLPCDKVGLGLTKEQMKEIAQTKDSVIQNGKLRGFIDGNGKLYNDKDTHIGYVDEFNNITYLN